MRITKRQLGQLIKEELHYEIRRLSEAGDEREAPQEEEGWGEYFGRKTGEGLKGLKDTAWCATHPVKCKNELVDKALKSAKPKARTALKDFFYNNAESIADKAIPDIPLVSDQQEEDWLEKPLQQAIENKSDELADCVMSIVWPEVELYAKSIFE